MLDLTAIAAILDRPPSPEETGEVGDAPPPVPPEPPPQEERPALHIVVSDLDQYPPVCLTEARELEAVLPALCAAPLVGGRCRDAGP